MDVERFLEDLAPAPAAPVGPVLARMQVRGEEAGFPIIGPLVGRYVAQWARAVDARRVFEMGSGFGYSTLWFADAVGAEGEVVHTDGAQRLSDEARGWLDEAGLASRVRFQVGDARALIKTEDAFDVVFIDIDKEQYPEAWRLARDRVRPGGLIITDNALWGGKVADPMADDDATAGVRAYLEAAHRDPEFVTTVAPIRDGVAVSLRVGSGRRDRTP